MENSTENSIAALANAQKLGIHGAEFDVWITTDDVPVINHNATVTGSDLRIEESAYAQIRDLTLANGEVLPTLDAYLEQGARDASMKLICEIKTHSSAASNTRAVNAVVAAVKAKSMESRVDYIAFDYEVCKQLRAAMPAAGVQYLGGDKAPAEVAADKALGHRLPVFDRAFEKARVGTEAHARGIRVNAWGGQFDGRHDGLHRAGCRLHHHRQPRHAEKTAGDTVRHGSEITAEGSAPNFRRPDDCPACILCGIRVFY